MRPAAKLITRAVHQYETEAHFHVMCEAFGLEADAARGIYLADPFFDLSHKRILFDGSSAEAVAGLTVIPTSIRLVGGAVITAGGLAGVGTVPPRRNQGLASALLKSTLRDMYSELGYSLSALMTDRPDYYRRFGWETCSSVIHWQTTPQNLPRNEVGLAVQEVSGDKYGAVAGEIHALFQSVGEATPGTFVRDERRWRCIETLSPGRRVAVWQPRGRVEAYVAYDVSDDSGTLVLDVHEIVATGNTGTRALISYLAGQSEAKRIRGRMNRTTLCRTGLDQVSGISQIAEDGVMLRMLSIEDCLATVAQTGFYTPLLARSPEGLTIRVDSSTLPENNKPVRLFTVTDGSSPARIAIAPADELVDRWIAAPIGALTQMFVGFRSPTELHNAGELRTSSEEAVALADTLFPRTDPFLAPPDTF